MFFVTVDIKDSSLETNPEAWHNNPRCTAPWIHERQDIERLLQAWRHPDRKSVFDPRQRIRTTRIISCRWWRRTRRVFLAPTRSSFSSLPDVRDCQDFRSLLSLHIGEWNLAWVLRSRPISVPVSFRISFALFSFYNARTGSETYPKVTSRNNQKTCPTITVMSIVITSGFHAIHSYIETTRTILVGLQNLHG